MSNRITKQPFCQTRVMCRVVDNLELLLSQPDESVDLIYCDILYGTGKDFMDYKDLYPMREVIEEHYLPRLKEMHRVLKSTGSIYLQMDYRIEHWVRCMMDDIFGYGNFRNQIIWSYRIQGVSKKKYPSKHDNILFYSKSNTYTYKAEKERIYYNKKSFDVKIDDKGRYYSDVYVRDVWDCDYTKPLISGSNEYVNYKTQKPKALLKRIISNSSNEGDTVADYYLGSGTTAVVCKELNRNFIGCDINPKAIEITNARLDAVS
jgi:site-specific DNA-methyltransferase (adenine-specific)